MNINIYLYGTRIFCGNLISYKVYSLPEEREISLIKRIALRDAISISFILCTVLILAADPSCARMGYSINAQVNNTTWSWSQSTQTISFQMDSQVNGNGNYSRYATVTDFAGNSLSENTHTDNGTLRLESNLFLKSIAEYVHITEHVNTQSNEYTADINESMPTVLVNKDDLFFKGRSVYSRNMYSNGDNTIITDYHGSKLLKTVGYLGEYNNSIIHADVTASYVSPRILSNDTIALSLRSVSDRYSGFSLQSENSEWEEGYNGLFTIDKNLIIENRFRYRADEDPMECCLKINSS